MDEESASDDNAASDFTSISGRVDSVDSEAASWWTKLTPEIHVM